MATTVKLYNYNLKSVNTYLFAGIFILGNLILPQLAHLIPNGGPVLLPIYFFTLIAAYKYGLRVGLLTALLSPVINSLLFGMPMLAMLPVILVKSALLATAASLAANYFARINFWGILLSIAVYQIVGSGIEWIILQDFNAAMQDFTLGLPGMLIQLLGGYLLLKAIAKV